MGGLALKNCITRRYQKDEFEVITQIIKQKLLKIFSKCDMPKYFCNKESFGDADFVCCTTDDFNVDIKNFIMEEFNSKEIFQNTTVYSFEFRELQVDMILTPDKIYDTSLNYLAFNDINNLIGKIAHRFGLKWGQNGLEYVYRIDDKKLGNIVVSTDRNKSLTFLGLNAARYELGFDTLDEIFDFVTSSKYFNPWSYDFETLNRINRERDKKRATYKAFVDHVAPMKEKGIAAYHYFYSDKTVYLGHIDHFFPGFLKNYRNLEKREERLKVIRSLYNGNLIMEKFQLYGKELGKAMSSFSTAHGGQDKLENYILQTIDTNLILQSFAEHNKLPWKS